ncbi:MAG: glycoside hydrolase family 28 protein [Phycisphaerae bacterium]
MVRKYKGRVAVLSLCMVLSTVAGTTYAGPEATTMPSKEFTVDVALPTIPERTFLLTDFGAAGDGKTLNTQAFNKAVAAVSAAGGGHLIVPKGEYRTLPFTLCSNLDLHLDPGAVIIGPGSFTDYGLPEPESLASQEEVRQKVKVPPPLISGKNLHDVAITGSGTIDGNGALWWAWSERAARQHGGNRLVYPRPKLVTISGCDRLHVDGVTFRNSPMFHLVPNRVKDLLIENVRFEAPLNAPNTDAVDPGLCTNMVIRHCNFDVGDDDVAIKTGGHRLLIEDCQVKHGHGISIGSGTAEGVSEMMVRRCTIDGADNGIRIKSMRGAGGLVENVRYSDITMKNVANAIVLDLNYTDNNRPDFKGDPQKVPTIRNVLIENVTVKNARNAGKIAGLPESKITDVTLKNVHITAEKALVMEDVGKILRENMTCDVKAGVGPPKRTEIE